MSKRSATTSKYNLRPRCDSNLTNRTKRRKIERVIAIDSPLYTHLIYDIRYRIGEFLLQGQDYVTIVALGICCKWLNNELKPFLGYISGLDKYSYPILSSIGQYHTPNFLSKFCFDLKQLTIIFGEAIKSGNLDMLAGSNVDKCCTEHARILIVSNNRIDRFLMNYRDIAWNIGQSTVINYFHRLIPLILPNYGIWLLDSIIINDNIVLFKELANIKSLNPTIDAALMYIYSLSHIDDSLIRKLFDNIHNNGATKILQYLMGIDRYFIKYNAIFTDIVCSIMLNNDFADCILSVLRPKTLSDHKDLIIDECLRHCNPLALQFAISHYTERYVIDYYTYNNIILNIDYFLQRQFFHPTNNVIEPFFSIFWPLANRGINGRYDELIATLLSQGGENIVDTLYGQRR